MNMQRGKRKLTVAMVARPGVRGRRPTRSEDVMDCVKQLMDIWREISGNSLDLMVLIRV